MNLYFLVEGDRTEKAVYRAWVGHTFPRLSEAATAAALTTNGFVVVKTGGYPAYLGRIRPALADIAAHGGIDHGFICVDAEEVGRPARLRELRAAVAAARAALGEPVLPPIHLVVAECCIETWFLGHRDMMRPQPQDPALIECRRFYDVRRNDPEAMDAPRDRYRTKAAFHYDYLRAMLRDRSPTLRYSKTHCAPVLRPDYFGALRARAGQGHLASLKHLLDTWHALDEAG